LAQPVSDVISTLIIGTFVIKELTNKKYRAPINADAVNLEMAPATKE
jgi:hypothetical protein